MSGFGFSPVIMFFGAVLAVFVALIAVIDFRSYIIPDALNAGLGVSGLAFQVWTGSGFPYIPLAFAASVFLLFFGLRQWFKSRRQITALGLGDAKMAGASAIWISPWNLPLYLLVTCASALLFVLFSHLKSGNFDSKTKVPFGPFLGLGIFVTWALENSGIPTFIPNGEL